MRRLFVFLLTWTCLISAQAPAAAPSSDRFEGIDDAVAQLSRITGLQALKKVQRDTITRAAVRQFLEERIKEELKPEDIRLEELSLKRFGLVPKDFDLKSATVNLLTEQAAAFYDYRKKKLFLLEGDEPALPGAEPGFAQMAQKVIVVHELAHALADQHFNLAKYLKKGRGDDSATARLAVMEGQATWLMLESTVEGTGQSLKTMPNMIDLMATNTSQAMASQYPVLAGAPLYMKASLIFPYQQGLRFQQAVLLKAGKEGFSMVFKQPPSSTQQILHPEKYFARLEPLVVRLPDPPKAEDWKGVLDGSVGEFEHSILLEQYLSKAEAEEIAPHWRGGHMGLFESAQAAGRGAKGMRNSTDLAAAGESVVRVSLESKVAKNAALLYASEWDDTASARRMFDAYRRVLKGKWKAMTVTSESDNFFRGVGDEGPYLVTLDGTRVTSWEGIEGPAIQVN